MLVHAALANMTGVPELQISDDEGKALAQAIAEVQSFYGNVIDPKTEAWMKLAIVAGSTYVPRVMIARQRMAYEKAQRETNEPKPDNVTTIYGENAS